MSSSHSEVLGYLFISISEISFGKPILQILSLAHICELYLLDPFSHMFSSNINLNLLCNAFRRNSKLAGDVCFSPLFD